MRVALVHDDLVQWGGAERVLLGLLEIYPKASIYTSLYDKGNAALKKNFGSKEIITSFLQKIPAWKKLYKLLLPFYPIAFEQFDFSGYDLVISHTTRFAKSVITKSGTKHICYLHTPPRFLWHFSGGKGYGWAEILLSYLRVYDTIAAHRVDDFIAGSKNAQKRINKIYRKDSKVVYPFIDLNRFNKIESFDGGYFVTITRLNKYKRVDLAIKACSGLNFPIKIIGVGPDQDRLGKIAGAKNKLVEFLGELEDEMVVQVLAGCKALIIAGKEDFGLTSLEAQALGKPVIAFAQGGVLETVIPDKTGIFFSTQSVDNIKEAIKKLESQRIDPVNCKSNAGRFSKEMFDKSFKQTIAQLV